MKFLTAIPCLQLYIIQKSNGLLSYLKSNFIILSFILRSSIICSTPTFQLVIMHHAPTYCLHLYYHRHFYYSTTYFTFIFLTFAPLLMLFCYLSCSLHLLLLISDLWNSYYYSRDFSNVTSFLRHSHTRTIPLTSVSLSPFLNLFKPVLNYFFCPFNPRILWFCIPAELSYRHS